MRNVRNKAVHYGRNADNEDKYVRCSRCGFVCNYDKRLRADKGSRLGWGITYATQTSGTATDVSNPVVTGGCPQCGTYLYYK